MSERKIQVEGALEEPATVENLVRSMLNSGKELQTISDVMMWYDIMILKSKPAEKLTVEPEEKRIQTPNPIRQMGNGIDRNITPKNCESGSSVISDCSGSTWRSVLFQWPIDRPRWTYRYVDR